MRLECTRENKTVEGLISGKCIRVGLGVGYSRYSGRTALAAAGRDR